MNRRNLFRSLLAVAVTAVCGPAPHPPAVLRFARRRGVEMFTGRRVELAEEWIEAQGKQWMIQRYIVIGDGARVERHCQQFYVPERFRHLVHYRYLLES